MCSTLNPEYVAWFDFDLLPEAYVRIDRIIIKNGADALAIHRHYLHSHELLMAAVNDEPDLHVIARTDLSLLEG